MASKRSAGLILHRRNADGVVEVLLVHPGGPFWAGKDAHAWSIPKGEYVEGEDAETVALREFEEEARRITEAYPGAHGGPVHAGDPAELGIEDLQAPDFGDPVDIHDGEVSMFWACGVTPQLAIANARPEMAITHEPGHMFITDLPADPQSA